METESVARRPSVSYTREELLSQAERNLSKSLEANAAVSRTLRDIRSKCVDLLARSSAEGHNPDDPVLELEKGVMSLCVRGLADSQEHIQITLEVLRKLRSV